MPAQFPCIDCVGQLARHGLMMRLLAGIDHTFSTIGAIGGRHWRRVFAYATFAAVYAWSR